MAINASADRTIIVLRISPIPVGMLSVRNGFAASRLNPGRIPMLVPPASEAPRADASMTPPNPPHTTTAPACARRRPTSSAWAATSAEASPAPHTAT